MAKEKNLNSAVLTSEELSVFCDQIALMLESGMTRQSSTAMITTIMTPSTNG